MSDCYTCWSYKAMATRKDLPADVVAFLMSEWYAHQDRGDSVLCWNEYFSVADPSQMVEIA